MKPFIFCPICSQKLEPAVLEERNRMLCPKCGWVHYSNPLPVAIAFTRNTNGEVLLIRRAHEPAFNQWALPGGFIESSEEPHEGCLRELWEETSIEGSIESLVGVYHRESTMYGSLIAIAYRVLACHENICINHEVFEAGFYPADSLPEVTIPLHRQIIEESLANS
ncbi:NUDIX hydrolase [Chlorobium phaeovibrioides]|uniref:NUDIX domain-containing protein n=2 Tax=Chlorobium phaeovibrioides TaxID=1094 RepID=A0A432ATR6_CHLPH|nr:NUDIX hydrolase [Chlorobium phaeovibrioides]NQU45890.1 NUDIX hydrolase [Chlorobium sp.]KAA6232812.1 NUDIX hydrolase [Chlorobium phaeovibrioides]MDT9546731.1 NUDIX hydrolase [Chlorobium phaeovibrioides]MWV53971.1 NUDIX domain-containing protein [Chlorobium phaeovibrioides]QEQ56790.1 NUDIX hydrolase [Chlorobium phaeovibrioides]